MIKTDAKEIIVLKPIKVPDSVWCAKGGTSIYCRWLEFGRCLQGFYPEFDEETHDYKKPKECLELLWQENVVDSKNLGKETLIR